MWASERAKRLTGVNTSIRGVRKEALGAAQRVEGGGGPRLRGLSISETC